MTRIGPTPQLLAQIRTQALAFRREQAARGPGGQVGEPRRPAAEATQEDWSAQVARAVVAIAADDPQRRRKAFRVYLQAALARAFGIRAVEAKSFQDLVDRVQETMELDPQLRDAIEAAGKMLLEHAGG